MRLTCSQKDLISALTTTNKAVDANNTLPVLNNVLLKAEGKKLYFTSTNLEIAITCNIDADIKNEGEITIPSKLFTSYINYLKDNTINIVAEEGDIQINTSDSKTRVKGLPASEFPPIPPVEKAGGMTVDLKNFSRAISQVVFSAALNTTRPVLSGVYFFVEKDELKMAATDSYRLSEKKLSVSNVSGSINCIVPAKTILELGSVLDGMKEAVRDADSQQENSSDSRKSEDVTVVISKNQIMFSVGKVELISRLIEGQFPDYQQIIPASSKTSVEFDVSTVSLALKRINIFARENNNKIILKIMNGKALISTESTQYGEGEITLDVTIEGENNEIALNSQFILEALGSMGAGRAKLEIGDKIAPVILKPKDAKGYTHVIMPLKI